MNFWPIWLGSEECASWILLPWEDWIKKCRRDVMGRFKSLNLLRPSLKNQQQTRSELGWHFFYPPVPLETFSFFFPSKHKKSVIRWSQGLSQGGQAGLVSARQAPSKPSAAEGESGEDTSKPSLNNWYFMVSWILIFFCEMHLEPTGASSIYFLSESRRAHP